MALLMVVVALAILFSLSLPFLLSVTAEGRAALLRLAGQRARHGSAGLRDGLLRRAAASDPVLDLIPSGETPDLVDVPTELPRWTPPEGEAGELMAGMGQELGGEVYDAQSRICVEGAGPLVFANVLGWAAMVDQQVDQSATEITVDSTRGFPESGCLWILGELVRYEGKSPNAFLNCTRGVDWVEGVPGRWREPATYVPGAPVMDARAWHLATYPVIRGGRKAWRPWTSFEEMGEIAREGHGELPLAAIERMRTLMTIRSDRRFAPAWVHPQRLLRVETTEEGRCLLYLPNSRYFGRGCLIRIRGAGKQEYAVVFTSHNAPRQRLEVLASGGALVLEEPLGTSFEENEGVVEVLAPVPVNLNCAPPEVLGPLFAYLRRNKNLHSLQQGEAADLAGMVRDWVSPAEAESFARLLTELRIPGREPGTGPFLGPKDLVERVMLRMLSGGALEVNPLLLTAIYMNVLNSLDRGVTFGTSPLCLWSGPVKGYRAGVALFDEAGGERARSERTGVAWVRPEGMALSALFETQAHFDESLRLSRGARGWITLPNNTSFLDGRNDPPSRFLPHTWSMLPARMEAEEGDFEPASYFPLGSAESSGVRPAPARLELPITGRAQAIRHFDREPDPEGRDLGKRPYLAQFARGQERAGDQGEGLAQALQAGFFFRPTRGGSMTLLDAGAGQAQRDRVHLFLNGSELVLEVLDRAGLDPAGAGFGPARSAGAIRMPLSEYPFESGTWYHLRVQVLGNSPERMTLMVDGVPRGRPDCLTRLTAAIPAYDHQDEAGRYLEIQVEDTRGFPPTGVVRIGSELFEYTALGRTNLSCKRVDSRGGRDARHAGWEWNPEARTAPEESEAARAVPAPDHRPGEAVALYGYSVPLQESTTVAPVSFQLASDLGRWGVARLVNKDASISVGNRTLGQGIDEKHRGDLELGAAVESSRAGGDAHMAAFQKEGGYALLCQRMLVVQSVPAGGGQGNAETKVVGGVVLVYYGGVKGTKLTGVRLGGTLPFLEAGSLDPGSAAALAGTPGLPAFFDGQTRSFVGIWADREMEARSTNWAYVVPISLPLGGPINLLPDPTRTGCSEYVQILPRRPANTEWVRYDVIRQNFLIRCRAHAVQRMLIALGLYYVNTANTLSWPPPYVEALLKEVKATRADEIGYVESGVQPIDFWAGRYLGFRGPRETGTSTHAQEAGALVLPVFRALDRWGPMASLYGRPGRHDRIALVEGNQAAQAVGASAGPQVEWRTVNWTARIQYYNEADPAIPSAAHPSTLVALTEEVRGLFAQGDLGLGGRSSTGGRSGGQAQQANRFDRREVTRIVKFPSGEMPWRFRGRVQFGMPQTTEGFPADGLIDGVELGPVTRTLGGVAPQLLLAFPIGEAGGGRLTLRPDIVVPGEVVSTDFNLGRLLPESGCLLQVGREILAVRSVGEAGEITLAEGGRGLLGTQPSGHGMWEHATVLERPAATTLSMNADAGSPFLAVARADAFPVDRGLVLVDRELVHYVYSRRNLSLEMPARQAPAGWKPEEQTEEQEGRFKIGDGLFRGRFGTVPDAHPAGAAVIEFPFRYWDSWAERADAPEMHHLDLFLPSPRALFRSITWVEELPEAHVDLHALVRIDGRAEWSEPPAGDAVSQTPRERGLLLFDAPTREERPRWIGLQGSQLEVRFFPVYKPGAFDPVLFLAQGWKSAPTLRKVEISYEAPTVLLEEQESDR